MALPTAIFAMIAALGARQRRGALLGRRPARDGPGPRLQGSDRRRRRRREHRPAASQPIPKQPQRGQTLRRPGRRNADPPRRAGARPPPPKRSVAPPSPTGSAPTARRPDERRRGRQLGDREPPGQGRPGLRRRQKRLRRRETDRPGRHRSQRQPVHPHQHRHQRQHHRKRVLHDLRRRSATASAKKPRLHPAAGKNSKEKRTCRRSSAPADIATNNSNCRLAAVIAPNCANTGEVDTYTKLVGKNVQDKRTSKEPWEASPRNINVNSEGTTLTMGGGDYFVCKINMQNGQMIMAAGAHDADLRRHARTLRPQHRARRRSKSRAASIIVDRLQPRTGHLQRPGHLHARQRSGEARRQHGHERAHPLRAGKRNRNERQRDLDRHDRRQDAEHPRQPDVRIQTRTSPPPDITVASLLQRTRYVECSGSAAATPDANC